jgi:phosphate transport system protein
LGEDAVERHHFEQELQRLNGRIIEMGSKAERMIHAAVQGLVDHNAALAQSVMPLEREVNHMQVENDEIALKLLATQQPVATDLRFLVSAMKVNSELERISDQAVNIAETTLILVKEPPLKRIIDLPLMAREAMDMLRESLESFVKHDVILAKGVIMKDDRVDAFKDQLFRELLTYMISDGSTIPRAISLLLITRNLERIGDQATNIAEEVIYMVEGRDVRHPEKPPKDKV